MLKKSVKSIRRTSSLLLIAYANRKKIVRAASSLKTLARYMTK